MKRRQKWIVMALLGVMFLLAGCDLGDIVDSYVLHTSTVVEFELYAGATREQKQQDVGLVLMHCTVMPLTSDAA